MPQDLRETRLFEQAEIAKFTKQELQEYEESLKAYRDWYSVTKTAFDKGKAEGREEGIEQGKAIGIEQGKNIGIEQGKANKAKEIALNLISNGLPSELIASATGLSIEDIDNMR